MAVSYNYTFSSINFPAATQTIVYGVNDAGDTVGIYGSTTSTVVAPNTLLTLLYDHSFSLIKGDFSTIGTYNGRSYYSDLNGDNKYEGSVFSGAYRDTSYDINNKGQILKDTSVRLFSGILISAGDDGTPGYTIPTGYTAYGINDTDQVVGANFTATGGIISDFSYGIARGINNQGDIVGYYGNNGQQHGFLVENGSFKTIDVPGAVGTQAFGINEKGQIAGTYTDGLGHHHGFVETNGVFSTVDKGTVDTFVYGINNLGQVVGSYGEPDKQQGFIATPQEVAGTGDTLTFRVSEDQWKGHPDVQFVIKVDGKQVGDVYTATALHSLGQTQDVTVTGDFSHAKNASIEFLNDQFGGTDQDVNLYIQSVTLNGVSQNGSEAVLNAFSGKQVGTEAELFRNGSAVFKLPPDTLTFRVSEDQWKGHPDAQFVIKVDGKQVGDVYTATALHSLGQTQDVTVTGDFSHAKNASIEFLNDQFGGTDQDVNLYVQSVTLNGQSQAGSTAAIDSFSGMYHGTETELFRSGAAVFKIDHSQDGFLIA